MKSVAHPQLVNVQVLLCEHWAREFPDVRTVSCHTGALVNIHCLALYRETAAVSDAKSARPRPLCRLLFSSLAMPLSLAWTKDGLKTSWRKKCTEIAARLLI